MTMTKTLIIGQKTTSSSSKDTCPLRVERLQFEFTCSTSLKVVWMEHLKRYDLPWNF